MTSTTRAHISNVTFAGLGLHPATQQAIASMGFTHLTQVQAETLPLILEGQDVLARARTGTGKTVAFLLPCIERMARVPTAPGGIDVLILSPTRELASQIAKEASTLCRYHGFRTEFVVGGSNMNSEKNRIMSNAKLNILVATPGRLKDHLTNTPGFVQKFARLQYLVLDEADQLLEQGFQPDIVRIIGMMPPKTTRQNLLFSATVPRSLHAIVHLAMRDTHKFVDTVGEEQTQTNAKVDQQLAVVPFENHLAVLEMLLRQHIADRPKDFKVIVFFSTARVVGFMANLYQQLGLPVLEMHSRKSQAQRTKISDKFRGGQALIMFTSDVSARGVDYPDVSLVIQVGLTTRDQYIHRAGRTARADQSGHAVLLLSPFERVLLPSLKDLPITDISETAAIRTCQPSPALTRNLQAVRSNDEMVKMGEQAYQAFLGFYNSNLRLLRWTPVQLVDMANFFARVIGLPGVPVLQKKTVGKMGLRGVPGLIVQ